LNKSEILTFISANPAAFLATVEENRPHVRGILIYRADEKGIVFHTGKSKDLYRQLTQNPEVEFSFNNFKDGIQIRVSGRLEQLEDLDLKKEIVAKRLFLKPWVEERGYEFLVLYRLSHGKASIWTMATNLALKRYIEL
jgi:pyridoxamine 5'-phosphate oxidase